MRSVVDQESFMKHGVHREMLTEAFKSLENLETVDVRDFNAPRRRDGTDWQPWGAKTFFGLTGILPRPHHHPTSRRVFMADLFSVLLYSLGLAAQPLPRFEVLLRNGIGLPDSSFFLPDFLFRAVRPVLQELKVLYLTVESGPLRNLHHFLNCTPNLQDNLGANDDFLRWFAADQVYPIEPPQPTKIGAAVAPPPALFQLTTLELGLLRTTSKTLLLVIEKVAPRLERLSLWRISFDSYRRADTSHRADTSQWTQFFKDMASIKLPALKYLKLGGLSIHGSIQMGYIEILGKDMTSVNREYSGNDISGFLQSLADEIGGPAPVVESDSEEEEGMNSDEEHDDEQNDEDEDEEDGSDSD
jgi:hypothetical protein